jgi:hypothetical protein
VITEPLAMQWVLYTQKLGRNMSLLPIFGSQHYIHFSKKAEFFIFVMLALGRIMVFKYYSRAGLAHQEEVLSGRG